MHFNTKTAVVRTILSLLKYFFFIKETTHHLRKTNDSAEPENIPSGFKISSKNRGFRLFKNQKKSIYKLILIVITDIWIQFDKIDTKHKKIPLVIITKTSREGFRSRDEPNVVGFFLSSAVLVRF